MIRILLADSHEVVRTRFRQILAEEPDMCVAGEVSEVQGVIDFLRRSEVDFVLVDISLFGKRGLEFIGDLKQIRPGLSFLVLSTYPEEQYAVRALWAGAAGYISKVNASEELVAAIRRISRGNTYLSTTILQGQADVDRLELRENLTDSEYQVMLGLASGKNVDQISDEMVLSSEAVTHYRACVFEKLQVRSNRALTILAAQNHLI